MAMPRIDVGEILSQGGIRVYHLAPRAEEQTMVPIQMHSVSSMPTFKVSDKYDMLPCEQIGCK